MAETKCERCRGRNIVWFTENKLWNAVVAFEYRILCPMCFVELAEMKSWDSAAWRLMPEVSEETLRRIFGEE